jgi:hypothetical protein
MIKDRRLQVAAAVGLTLVLAAGASDFVVDSFWGRHGMLTSLVANLIVVGVTVAVVNQVVEARDRRRWSLLAQTVLFALIQSARATWTTMLEVLELADVESGSVESLLEGKEVALDATRVSKAADALVHDEGRRAQLQRASSGLSSHASDVIAKWSPVMINAGPYAEMLDRHVELAARLEWLNNVLTHNEPPEGQSRADRTLTRSAVGTEHAEQLGTDEWLHDQILAIVTLATKLDYESRDYAYAIAPLSWWSERTAGLAGNEAPPEPLSAELPAGSEHTPSI